MKSLTKIAIVLLAVAAIGTTVLPKPAQAKDLGESIRQFSKSIENSVFKSFGSIMGNMIQVGDDGNNIAVSASAFFNNSAFKTARTAYNNTLNAANKTYNTARNTAHKTFVSALNSAPDQSSRYSAFKTYLTSLLSAIHQRNVAKEAALQTFIDSISNVQVNQAPTANSQNASVSENSSVAITLTGTDPEAHALTFTVLNNPTHGALSGTVPNLTYTPATNYNGADSFTFRVNDGTQNSNTATVSITVTGVNHAPTANAQSVSLSKNTSKGITLTGSDPEGSALIYTVVTNSSHGTLSGTVPNLTYLPATDYTGTDSFTFKVNDGSLDSTPATVSITVNP